MAGRYLVGGRDSASFARQCDKVAFFFFFFLITSTLKKKTLSGNTKAETVPQYHLEDRTKAHEVQCLVVCVFVCVCFFFFFFFLIALRPPPHRGESSFRCNTGSSLRNLSGNSSHAKSSESACVCVWVFLISSCSCKLLRKLNGGLRTSKKK